MVAEAVNPNNGVGPTPGSQDEEMAQKLLEELKSQGVDVGTLQSQSDGGAANPTAASTSSNSAPAANTPSPQIAPPPQQISSTLNNAPSTSSSILPKSESTAVPLSQNSAQNQTVEPAHEDFPPTELASEPQSVENEESSESVVARIDQEEKNLIQAMAEVEKEIIEKEENGVIIGRDAIFWGAILFLIFLSILVGYFLFLSKKYH